MEATVRAFGHPWISSSATPVFDRSLPLADFPEDKLAAACDERFRVNITGGLLGAKAVLPELLKTNGCLLFTASVAGVNSAGGSVL